MQLDEYAAIPKMPFILLWTVIWSQNKLYISNEIGKKTRKVDLNIKEQKEKTRNIFNKFVSKFTQRQINVSVVTK